MLIKRVILVHGFNVSDGGKGSTDKLRPGLEAQGLEVCEFDTHWRRGLIRDLISVRLDNDKRARRLARSILPGDLLIGHSNGCDLIDRANWYLACMAAPPAVACMYLNAALDRDAPLAPQVLSTWVFHTQSDRVVGLARRLIGSRWGSMGRDGYHPQKGDEFDTRYTNLTYEHHGLQDMGHSGVLRTPAGIEAILWRVKFMLQYAATVNP